MRRPRRKPTWAEAWTTCESSSIGHFDPIPERDCAPASQAQQALANSGKRLPTNAEWQQAAAGTPDNGATLGTRDCNTSGGITVATGSRSNCVSGWGANDMIGNLSEWVADWVPAPTASPGWGTFSDDRMALSGASTTEQGPAALIRGGSWGFGPSAGVFAVDWSVPSGTDNDIGFRGAR